MIFHGAMLQKTLTSYDSDAEGSEFDETYFEMTLVSLFFLYETIIMQSGRDYYYYYEVDGVTKYDFSARFEKI